MGEEQYRLNGCMGFDINMTVEDLICGYCGGKEEHLFQSIVVMYCSCLLPVVLVLCGLPSLESRLRLSISGHASELSTGTMQCL